MSDNKIQASFFLTGNFYLNPEFKAVVRGLKEDGNYLGAHSDKHLLYADWTKRDSTLVTRKQFREDLKNNYKRMTAFGIREKDANFFLPAYEWYNNTIAGWTKEMGLTLVNFSPGTRSTSDYTYPGMAGYRGSEEIYNSITDQELKDPNGLNGFILLIHIGTDARRTDKMYNKLDQLLKELKGKGYSFVRIDKLLQE